MEALLAIDDGGRTGAASGLPARRSAGHAAGYPGMDQLERQPAQERLAEMEYLLLHGGSRGHLLGHASVESTQIYTQVSIRALQAVHASTHPAEQPDGDETGLPADLMAEDDAQQDEGVDGAAKEENTNR